MLHPLLKRSLVPLVCFAGLISCKTSFANQPSTAIIQSLTAGDRACYVELMDDLGNVSTQYADFEICEQDLVGQRVELIYEAANIQAASCEGDPDCRQTEEVMLIVEVQVIK